jgi:hypothetical protein
VKMRLRKSWEAAVLPLNYARARPRRLEDAGI